MQLHTRCTKLRFSGVSGLPANWSNGSSLVPGGIITYLGAWDVRNPWWRRTEVRWGRVGGVDLGTRPTSASRVEVKAEMGGWWEPVPVSCSGSALLTLRLCSPGRTIRFSTSPGMMPSPTAHGRESVCPRRPSGSTAVEEACKIGTWRVSPCLIVCGSFF